MARFKVGQQVVCIAPDTNEWRRDMTGPICDGPKYKEIVTVSGYEPNDSTSALFYEYPFDDEGYQERWFEPLMDISELEEILEAQPETQTK